MEWFLDVFSPTLAPLHMIGISFQLECLLEVFPPLYFPFNCPRTWGKPVEDEVLKPEEESSRIAEIFSATDPNLSDDDDYPPFRQSLIETKPAQPIDYNISLTPKPAPRSGTHFRISHLADNELLALLTQKKSTPSPPATDFIAVKQHLEETRRLLLDSAEGTQKKLLIFRGKFRTKK